MSARSSSAAADGVAPVESAAGQDSLLRRIDAVLVGIVSDRSCGDGRNESDGDSRPSQRLDRWSRKPHGYCCSIVATSLEEGGCFAVATMDGRGWSRTGGSWTGTGTSAAAEG